ncbi:MAG: homoserine dehydrogenase [Cyclobacteriaceae bacterium]|nr:homoserine dehydrogenase [Cyclobacteriaceae bacterium]MCH8516118.1 homoserine dehydrogenase [Cyclobacteriaceae bacterium]
MSTQKIGLLGFGCVGEGVYNICQNGRSNSFTIGPIGVKRKNVKRILPESRFEFQAENLIENDNDLYIEAISETDAAYDFFRKVREQDKPIVLASKKMVADHLKEIADTAVTNPQSIAWEATCCGAIPVVRTIDQYFDQEKIKYLGGVFNGSSNYILTRLHETELDFDQALLQAQELGFAEADPSLDVDGWDAANKLSILILHAFGQIIHPRDIWVKGIRQVSKKQVSQAQRNKLKIKLLAHAQLNEDNELQAFLAPSYVPEEHPLYSVENEDNAVSLDGEYSGLHLFKGKGAGSYTTGSAVIADAEWLKNGGGYKLSKYKAQSNVRLSQESTIRVAISGHHIPKDIWTKLEHAEEGHASGSIALKSLKALSENRPELSIISLELLASDIKLI